MDSMNIEGYNIQQRISKNRSSINGKNSIKFKRHSNADKRTES